MHNKWLKLSVLISSIFIFTACSDEKSSTDLSKTSVEKKETYDIPWVKDLPTAFELAKKEKKNVMVMAVSEGCRWCDKMKAKTLSNEKVAKKLQEYILVQADRETPSQRDQLPEFKHVPIIFFMKPNREVIDNLRGYFEAEDFLEYLNELEEI
ncbi:thioredoxin family protein [bacterium]|nr:thioredoxin family protein [bacterium]MBU1959315.1 thioredoxin family protein [bacterium]